MLFFLSPLGELEGSLPYHIQVLQVGHGASEDIKVDRSCDTSNSTALRTLPHHMVLAWLSASVSGYPKRILLETVGLEEILLVGLLVGINQRFNAVVLTHYPKPLQHRVLCRQFVVHRLHVEHRHYIAFLQLGEMDKVIGLVGSRGL